jgi:hypothetical protein
MGRCRGSFRNPLGRTGYPAGARNAIHYFDNPIAIGWGAVGGASATPLEEQGTPLGHEMRSFIFFPAPKVENPLRWGPAVGSDRDRNGGCRSSPKKFVWSNCRIDVFHTLAHTQTGLRGLRKLPRMILGGHRSAILNDVQTLFCPDNI